MPGETTNDFRKLVLEDVPLIDVRAPVEYAAGAFPTAVNLPLMVDEERHQVGIRYKQAGQEAAIALGHELVSGDIKADRIAAWRDFLERHPSALIYCFRGGLRSKLSQEWTEAAVGRDVPRLEGGYKAFRTFLMNHLESDWIQSEPLVLGGRTGSGKTILLRELDTMIDLEALANHRGSSFGRFIDPQPTQIDFEDALAWTLIQYEAAGNALMVVEDEGRHVGSRYIPSPLVEHFASADVIQLETPLAERVQITFDEYVTIAQQTSVERFGNEGLAEWAADIRGSMLRVKKRLGGERLKRSIALLEEAQAHQLETGDATAHAAWIEVLLHEYYDPMYDYQLEQKKQKIVFRGDAAAVKGYIASRG